MKDYLPKQFKGKSKGVPSAALWYKDSHHVKLTKEQLSSIETTVFTTHRIRRSEKIHRISQFLLLPWRKSLQLLGSAFQSRPGENKETDTYWRSRPISILVGFIGFAALLISAAIAVLTLPFHFAALYVYWSRPIISYINNANAVSSMKESVPEMSKQHPLHVRTHNLGFVLETMSIIGDLRPVRERAYEVADSILKDRHQPDVICFQEAFHEDGTGILANELKNTYPYIISNVLPTASGFNSGMMVASKYPIEDVEFHCLKHNLGVERVAPKGMIRVKILSSNGAVNIYSAHTQALLGKDRAKARCKQLKQMKEIMERDFRQDDSCQQVLMGDLNTSTLTAWGEDNLSDPNNPEAEVQTILHEEFHDIYLNDHKGDGTRQEGEPEFLRDDNERMNVKELPEPSGSWYIGPFATSSTFLASNVQQHNIRDRKQNNYTVKSVISSSKFAIWGTKEWRREQPANTARFDYVLFPRYNDRKPRCDARAEIRRIVVPAGKQSAPTDHLPVDAKIWRSQ